jgi:hypothetical protein
MVVLVAGCKKKSGLDIPIPWGTLVMLVATATGAGLLLFFLAVHKLGWEEALFGQHRDSQGSLENDRLHTLGFTDSKAVLVSTSVPKVRAAENVD